MHSFYIQVNAVCLLCRYVCVKWFLPLSGILCNKVLIVWFVDSDDVL